MRYLLMTGLLLLGVSCEQSIESDEVQPEQKKETIDFVFVEEEEQTRIFLKKGDQQRYVKSISAPGAGDIAVDDYSSYDIPPEALVATSSFWAGLSEVLYVVKSGEIYQIYFSERDEMDEGPFIYQLLKEINFKKSSDDELKPPYYIINTKATKDKVQAEKEASILREEGYPADYLWIPDYASLSGAEFYTVYIGPYKTKQECAIAVDQYRIENPKAYGTLVSHQPGRVTVGGINDAVK